MGVSWGVLGHGLDALLQPPTGELGDGIGSQGPCIDGMACSPSPLLNKFLQMMPRVDRSSRLLAQRRSSYGPPSPFVYKVKGERRGGVRDP